MKISRLSASSVRGKLALITALGCAAIVCLTATGVIGVSQAGGRAQAMHAYLENLNALHDATEQFYALVIAEKNHMISPDDQARIEAEAAQALERTTRGLERFASTVEDESVSESVSELSAAVELYLAIHARVIEASSKYETESAAELSGAEGLESFRHAQDYHRKDQCGHRRTRKHYGGRCGRVCQERDAISLGDFDPGDSDYRHDHLRHRSRHRRSPEPGGEHHRQCRALRRPHGPVADDAGEVAELSAGFNAFVTKIRGLMIDVSNSATKLTVETRNTSAAAESTTNRMSNQRGELVESLRETSAGWATSTSTWSHTLPSRRFPACAACRKRCSPY